MKNIYQEAIDVQNACNPSGVAHLFVRVCEAFRKMPEHNGTDSLRANPALQLVAFKLAELMSPGCVSFEVFHAAYNAACAESDKIKARDAAKPERPSPYMTRAQSRALLALWKRLDESTRPAFLAFRRMAYRAFGDDCYMVPFAGMVVGIEKDGYAHS